MDKTEKPTLSVISLEIYHRRHAEFVRWGHEITAFWREKIMKQLITQTKKAQRRELRKQQRRHGK